MVDLEEVPEMLRVLDGFPCDLRVFGSGLVVFMGRVELQDLGSAEG